MSGLWKSVVESVRGSRQDFTSGNLNRAVLLLAVPMVLEMAGESLFVLVDAYFVGRLGSASLAALGLTETLLAIVYSIGMGLAMATTALVARRTGEKDERTAARTAVQAIISALAIAFLIGVPGAIYAPELLRLMGAEQAVVDVGTTFARIQLLAGVPVIILLFVNNAIFRGAGDASMAMRSVWLANLLNIPLDYALIFGAGPFPELGLTGAAVATTTGRAVGVAYQFWHLGRGYRIRITREDLGFDGRLILRLLSVMRGGVGQMLVSHVSYVGSMRMLAAFSEVALAGYTLAIRVVLFVIFIAWGISNAAAALVGQNLGAEKPDRAERAVWVTGVWNMAYMAVVTVLFVALAGPIMEIMAPGPETAAVGRTALTVISLGYVFYAWGMVTFQAFNGAGDTATPTRLNILVFWFFQLPLAYVLAFSPQEGVRLPFGMGMGPTGIFLSMTLAYSLSAVLGVWLFRRGSWKSKKV
ncbi:MAG: MATE family efflux transporter [Gemmatimonadetes bacterium]|nr:MATE family efflux transporter [Gemmatimonadota bacterium]